MTRMLVHNCLSDRYPLPIGTTSMATTDTINNATKLIPASESRGNGLAVLKISPRDLVNPSGGNGGRDGGVCNGDCGYW